MSADTNESQNETQSAASRQCRFREHGRLTEMLGLFPTQTQKGIFGTRIEYTCIDVIPEYIVVGTDVGIILLYDRVFHQMHKLDCKVCDPKDLRILHFSHKLPYVSRARRS